MKLAEGIVSSAFLCIKSNAFGCDESTKIIEDLFRKKFPKYK